MIFGVCTFGIEHGRSSVWSTGRMEPGCLQGGFQVEWNRKIFSVGYQSMEMGDPQCGYRWNKI